MKRIVILIAFLPSSVIAQSRIDGLVEIPALHDPLNSGVRDTAVGPVTLFASANNRSEVSVIVREWRELESREHGYEQVSAVVFDRESNSGGGFWYLLKYIKDGVEIFGWLNQAEAGQYRAIHSFIYSQGSTYLTSEWDRRLFEAPGVGSPAISLADLDRDQPVRVIDIHEQEGEYWYLVALVQGRCTGDPLEVIAVGWVPWFSDTGNVAVWYRSRGC